MTEPENYSEPLYIQFRMPSVRLISMESNKLELDAIGHKLLRRVVSWALASRKRKFVLEKNFEITIDKFSDNRLNGTLTVPAQENDQKIEFDGASIPLPWLAAALSFEVLRPLGAVLIPSIVHDYLFEKGQITVEQGGKTTIVEVDREIADRLFLDIFRSVSGMRLWPRVAWLAVRAGAPFFQYKGKRGAINRVTISVALALLTLFWFLYLLAPVVFCVLLILLPGLTLMDWLVDRITRRYKLKK